MTMRELTYQVSFNTPAFLGNAEQQAQWRTPPFKALLRQWWRVVKAPDVDYVHRRLLTLENDLFGSAGGDDGGGRSKVQLRLSGWDAGTVLAGRDSVELKYVDHPDVDPRTTRPHQGEKKVRADVYLGYGPIGKSSAIDAINRPQTFKLRFPTAEEPALRKAMQLASWFGTLGSRSRNGWGSLHIEGEGVLGWDDLCDSKLAEQSPLRSVADAMGDRLANDWPHAVGLCADGRPAIWRVVSGRDAKEGKYLGFDNWRMVMEQLAALKIGFRTQFKLNSGAPHSRVEDRHVLAYPVTNHGLAKREPNKPDNARLASQMRFKVAKSKDGKYFGLITHLPCAMPRAFFETNNIAVRPPEIKDQISVWQQVHQFLNAQSPTLLNRIRKG